MHKELKIYLIKSKTSDEHLTKDNEFEYFKLEYIHNFIIFDKLEKANECLKSLEDFKMYDSVKVVERKFTIK